MGIRNIVYDNSGVVTDDIHNVLATVNAMLVDRDLDQIPLERYRALIVQDFRSFWTQLGVEDPIASIQREYEREYAQLPIPGLLPGAYATLQFFFENKIPQYMVSAQPTEFLLRELATNHVASFFTEIIGMSRNKTQDLAALLQRNSANPKETVFITDMTCDILAGRACGVHTLAVLSGYHTREQLSTVELNPANLIPDITALPRWIEHYQ
ncbi:HAD family hydrolase [Candidatus Woesearchaeota archaeon]|nr:HAD family hydrolase [Candidatus Woesearchaeota archaeon]